MFIEDNYGLCNNLKVSKPFTHGRRIFWGLCCSAPWLRTCMPSTSQRPASKPSRPGRGTRICSLLRTVYIECARVFNQGFRLCRGAFNWQLSQEEGEQGFFNRCQRKRGYVGIWQDRPLKITSLYLTSSLNDYTCRDGVCLLLLEGFSSIRAVNDRLRPPTNSQLAALYLNTSHAYSQGVSAKASTQYGPLRRIRRLNRGRCGCGRTSSTNDHHRYISLRSLSTPNSREPTKFTSSGRTALLKRSVTTPYRNLITSSLHSFPITDPGSSLKDNTTCVPLDCSWDLGLVSYSLALYRIHCV